MATSMESADDKIDYWRAFSIRGKVIEAKYLVDAKSETPKGFYCVSRIDNQYSNEIVTNTITNTDTPFWAEDFAFESKLGFKEIKFIVWMDDKTKSDSAFPIGKVVIPRSFIKSAEEQWYMLLNADNETKTTGSVQIRIKHFPPKMKRKVHGFSVSVLRARLTPKRVFGGDKLATELPNPYAVCHLFPDPDALSTQHTHCQPRTITPTFAENFYLSQETVNDLIPPSFLGHVTIPLGPVVTKSVTYRWYSLSLLDADESTVLTKPKGRKKSITDEEKRSKPRDFVKNLHSIGVATPQTQKPHKFVDKTFALSSCHNCNGVMVGTQSSCTDCSVSVHNKCKDSMTPTCGGYGALRLKIDVNTTFVLNLPMYQNLIDILQEEDFQLLIILGRVSQSREDAARSLIKVFNDKYVNFVKSCVRQEILQSDDSKTLFRANSMASKCLDVYMKHVASDYLRATLEDVLKLIILSKKPFEMDPLRLIDTKEKIERSESKKKKESESELSINATNLRELNMIVTKCIFDSAPKMPRPLKEVFNMIKSTVLEKFPDSDVVKYTAISGFIFLRFFAPAILGPSLFGLKVGNQDATSARKLLLIAKTLQNLSNLVEFGQKEAFMEPMNSFILSQIDDMKKFIDTISSTTPSPKEMEVKLLKYSDDIVARECAEVHAILATSLDKMIAFDSKSTLLPKLVTITNEIDSKLKIIQEKEKNQKFDILNDTGIDIDEKESKEDLFDDHEKRIMRMLTRCASNDSLDSPRSSIGMYRSSGDMKESSLRGSIIPQPSVAVTFVSYPDVPLNTITGSLGIQIDDSTQSSFKDTAEELYEVPTQPTIMKKRGTLKGFTSLFSSNSEKHGSSTPKESPRSSTADVSGDTCHCPPERKLERQPSDRSDGADGKIQRLGSRKNENAEDATLCNTCGKPKPQERGILKRHVSLKNRLRSSTLYNKPNSVMSSVINDCPRCMKEIGDSEPSVPVEQKNYHHDCFCCKDCQAKFTDVTYTWKDDIYCKQCYFIHAGLVCSVCNQAIMKEHLIVNGEKFHATCRRCSVFHSL
ncbi:hypothetical protein HDV02_006326 [Globomyces sp. JEL0801]|nr:hypothetical protein HDV02_006326 [Globomyces sp. JEL0801]